MGNVPALVVVAVLLAALTPLGAHAAIHRRMTDTITQENK
jgi:hypothetical protein